MTFYFTDFQNMASGSTHEAELLPKNKDFIKVLIVHNDMVDKTKDTLPINYSIDRKYCLSKCCETKPYTTT